MSPDSVDPPPSSEGGASVALKPTRTLAETAAMAVIGMNDPAMKAMFASAAEPAAMFAQSGIRDIINASTKNAAAAGLSAALGGMTAKNAAFGQAALAGMVSKNAVFGESALAGLNVKHAMLGLGHTERLDIIGKLGSMQTTDTIAKLASGWAKDYGALASASALGSFAKLVPMPEIAAISVPEAISVPLPPPPPTAALMRELFHDMRDQVTSEIRVNTAATNANTAATDALRRATLPLWATLTISGTLIVLAALAVVLPLLHH